LQRPLKRHLLAILCALQFAASGEGHACAAHKIWLQRAATTIYSVEFSSKESSQKRKSG
jgi:hypothetical protein